MLFLMMGMFPRIDRLELGLGFMKWAMQGGGNLIQYEGPDWDGLWERMDQWRKEIPRIGRLLEAAHPSLSLKGSGKRKGIFTHFLFEDFDQIEEKELHDRMRSVHARDVNDPEHARRLIQGYLQGQSALNQNETRKQTTSDYLSRLILALVQPETHTSMCDLGSGVGILGVQALLKNPELQFCGQEIEARNYFLSLIHLAFMGYRDVDLQCGDVLSKPLLKDGDGLRQFDAVVGDLPTTYHVYDLRQMEFPQRFKEGFSKTLSNDWLFAQHALYVMKQWGVAVLVLSTPSLNKASDISVRQSLVLQDRIDAIIELPDLITDTASQPRSILILRKEKPQERKGKILMIDLVAPPAAFKEKKPAFWIEEAASIYHEGRIEPGISVWTSAWEIEAKGFLLGASGYVQSSMLLHDGVSTQPLKAMTQTIFRGLQLRPDQYEIAAQQEGEQVYLLNSGDIQDLAFLETDRPKTIQMANRKWSIYALEEGDLVLSARGTTIRSMVIGPQHLPAIASSNVLCIRANKEKADPRYLKAFFDSPKGQSLLNTIQTGRTIKVINPGSLETLPIPCPDIEWQRNLGENYRQAQEEFNKARSVYEKRLEKIFEAQEGSVG